MVQTTASTAPAAELLAAFRSVVKLLERSPIHAEAKTRATWEGSPLAPRHVAALMQVVADERLSVTALAERLHISLATASQLVTDLENRQLVDRVEDPADRRRTLLTIAEAHRPFTDAVLATRLRPVQRALDRLRPNEQRAFIRGLELMAEELGSSTR